MHMITKHGEAKVNELFHDIRSAILRSLLSVQNVIIQDKHCFELYGYDILVDKALKPWLLEVNASPSLAADTPQDRELKYGMLDDVLTLVDMERRLPTQTSLQVQDYPDIEWYPMQVPTCTANDCTIEAAEKAHRIIRTAWYPEL